MQSSKDIDVNAVQTSNSAPVLLLCDSAGEASNRSVLSALEGCYSIVNVHSVDRLLDFVMQNSRGTKLAAILISEQIGFRVGVGLINTLKQMVETQGIPILVLGSGKSDLGFDIWLQAGAKGYVVRLDENDRYSSLVQRGVTYWSTSVDSAYREIAAVS